jgi:choline transport protein
MHPEFRLPINTLCLITVICFILSLIYIGSSTAFNAIISLTTLSLYISYVCPILFIMIRKLRGQPLAYGPFNLGRWGIPINLLSLGYLIYAIIWIPFPITLPVTAQNMNYAGPIMLIIIIGALVDWSISGRKRFEVPVALPTLLDEK